MAEIENLKIGNNGTLHIVGNEDIVANAWQAGKTYVKNKSYVIHEHRLYVCNVTHTSVEPFDATKWTEITVIGAIDNALDMTDTASGAIATFESEYALPLRDCTIAINAVQESGTPTPSSPKAISGFTGANIKVAGNLLNGNKYQLGEKVVLLGELASNTYSTYLVKGTYTLSFKRPTNLNFRVDITDSNATQTNIVPVGLSTSATFTITKSGYYKFGTWISTSMLTTDITDIMLTGGSEVQPYTPYTTPTTTAITWQTEAGTVYGGSLDVTSGVLTVTHGYIDMGSLIWNTVGMGGGRTGFKSTISDIELAPAATVVFNGKCECYASLNGNDVYLGNTGIATWGANTHDIAVYDPDRESLSGADFKTAVTGSDLVYNLQTPETYQLTPTQISAIVGTNNVFTDTNGDTTLEYYTNKTVKDAINEVNDKADTNATAIGSLSALTTTDKSSLVGAVNEVNGAISYKEYVVQIGTSLWNGVYYAETNVATDVSTYGEILSAIVIDESEQSDFSSHTNRACFCQVITPNVIRLYSPQASNASGHYVKYRVTFSANAVNRT